MTVLEFTKNLAHQVGNLLLDYYQTSGIQAILKSDHSLVTEADLAADRMIIQYIRENYPEDFILSEELHPGSPTEIEIRDRAVWIIDPLDGTTNFSLGLHIWGILLTRLERGIPQTTVMYFPIMNELYSAQREAGAWMNENRLQVRPPKAEQPLPFFACCSRTFRRYHVNVPYKTRILGSSAYTFSAVARGIAILGFEATPKIWDIAGPWLLVREAGGVIETLDGVQPFPLQPGVDYVTTSYPTLAASTPQLAAEAHQQIIPKETASGL